MQPRQVYWLVLALITFTITATLGVVGHNRVVIFVVVAAAPALGGFVAAWKANCPTLAGAIVFSLSATVAVTVFDEFIPAGDFGSVGQAFSRILFVVLVVGTLGCVSSLCMELLSRLIIGCLEKPVKGKGQS